MRRCGLLLLALVAIGVTGAARPAAAAEPVTRTFGAPLERAWETVLAVLRSLGWEPEREEPGIGTIVTTPRDFDFREFGIYAQGTRHLLRLSVRAAGEGRASVVVEREVFREERILWMKERKLVPVADRSVETAVLDAIERSLPAVAPVPAGPAAAPGQTGARAEFSVKATYRVSGTAPGALLTYRNAAGETEQASVTLPWELSFTAKGGNFLYVSAQNEGAAGSVACEILLDDVGRTNSTSSGPYVIATCSNAAER